MRMFEECWKFGAGSELGSDSDRGLLTAGGRRGRLGLGLLAYRGTVFVFLLHLHTKSLRTVAYLTCKYLILRTLN